MISYIEMISDAIDALKESPFVYHSSPSQWDLPFFGILPLVHHLHHFGNPLG
jgi:hypothetical protein